MLNLGLPKHTLRTAACAVASQAPEKKNGQRPGREMSQGDFQISLVTWRFPKSRGTFLGVPIIRTIVFWGLYWGPLILGN